MQNIIYLEIQKPLKSQTPRKERSFLNKANCWKSAIWNFDRIQSTSLFYLHIVRSQRCFINWDHRIWSYETCSEGLKKHTGAHYATTPKNYQKTMFFGRVFYGFPRLKYEWSTVMFFLKRVKHNLFELHYGVLRVFYGLVRVFYRSHTIQLPGHHEHDENCHDWSLALFPGFLAPYTVMLWTSGMGLLMDTQWHGK